MPARSESFGKAAYIATCFAAIGFLSFVAGSVATLSESRPGRVVEDAYRAGTALYSKLTQYRDPLQFDLWRPARTEARGTTVYVPGKVQPGLTLYTSGHAPKAFLIDMEGRIVQEWGVPFSAIWDKSAAVRAPQPDSHVYIEKAVPYPNGDLLAIYVAVGDTPWGYGLVKMDKDSKVIWKYLAHAHHDVSIAPDGRIFALTQEIGKDDIPQFPHLKAPRVDDYVTILSPDGKELKKIRIIDMVLRSPYARLLDMVPWYVSKGAGDYLHTNAIEVLDGSAASKLPQANAGRVLLSFREISTIAIMDVEREEIVWAMRGPWLRQHDPDLLPNGNILLFDNQGGAGNPGGMTRVLEIDPQTQQIVWSYAGTPEHPFESEVRSSQERLANGNTLITESDGGRLFEVTPDGQIVWNWVNPVRAKRAKDKQEVIPIVSWAQRIDPAMFDPGLAWEPLTPGANHASVGHPADADAGG
ncbi:arylsulfotransferase family protein [Benzoatithermus flavus]|uniref:Arylsulfotransferase family protein n=1 Tax=Benzoatithermus flavus TaxID=3108223 RepID=A0ABU8XL41_9PROT